MPLIFSSDAHRFDIKLADGLVSSRDSARRLARGHGRCGSGGPFNGQPATATTTAAVPLIFSSLARIDSTSSSLLIFNNWRKHGESQLVIARDWPIDPFSSAPSFDGWRDLDARAIEWPRTYEPLPVSRPKTWLLREGWKRHGLISSREVPSRKAAALAFAEGN